MRWTFTDAQVVAFKAVCEVLKFQDKEWDFNYVSQENIDKTSLRYDVGYRHGVDGFVVSVVRYQNNWLATGIFSRFGLEERFYRFVYHSNGKTEICIVEDATNLWNPEESFLDL